MSVPKNTGKQRCPWCQHLLPRKVAPAHRCPAKPQTYLPELPPDLSPALAPALSKPRRA
jgi:hypothetical protein